MNKCFLVANVVVTDEERYAEYRAKVQGVIAQYGGRYVVRAGAIHPLEGDLGIKRMIMLEFDSMTAAREFYDSAEYEPLLKLRKETTQSDVAFIEGLSAA